MTSLRRRDPAGAIWWSSLQRVTQRASCSHYLASQAAPSLRMGREREPRAARPRSPWKRLSCVLLNSSRSSWGRKRAALGLLIRAR